MQFKVRDFRNKGFFILDDQYLNGYAKIFDPSTTVVYLSLCRHADKDQQAFPSQELIGREHNIHPRTVMKKIALLQEWKLIEIERIKDKKGKWLNNVYYLLDKSLWIKPPTSKIQVESTYIQNTKPPTSKVHIKDTHKKDTHIISKDIKEFGNSSINKGMELLTNFFGYKPNRISLNRYALHRLLKSRGEERVFKAMEFALSQQKNRYCPVITSYMDLEQKWAALEVYARREFSGNKKGGVVDATNL